MMKKILLTLAAVITLTAGMTLTAAAQETVDTFDYKAYADTYPDLKAVYGYDANALFAHYMNLGKAEGRVGSFAGDAAAGTGATGTATPAASTFSINTFSVGGDTYTLLCPVSEFIKNGWTIDRKASFAYADNGVESRLVLRKGNETFTGEVASPYLDKRVPIDQGLVRSYNVSITKNDGEHDFPASFVIGGCLTRNSTKEDVEAVLPDYFDKKEYMSTLFSAEDFNRFGVKRPLTTYCNSRTGFYEGRSDFLMTIYFTEQFDTIREVTCQYMNWAYEDYIASLN